MYVNRHAFITSGRLTLCRGWLLMYAGAFICSARDPAYELLITTKVGEKSVLASKDILYLTKILKALEVSKSLYRQQLNGLAKSFESHWIIVKFSHPNLNVSDLFHFVWA